MTSYIDKEITLDNGKTVIIEFCGKIQDGGVGNFEFHGQKDVDNGRFFCYEYGWDCQDWPILNDGERAEVEAWIKTNDEDIINELSNSYS